MSYIIRDENGGERVIAPWGGLDIERLPVERFPVERFPIEMSPSNEPTGWDRLPVPLPGQTGPINKQEVLPEWDRRPRTEPDMDPNAPGLYDPRVPRMDYWTPGNLPPEGPTTWPGGGVPRDLGDQSQRIPVIPYSEKANKNELGFLGKFVETMKRVGGKLMDKYQQNEAEKKEWRENNPGGYPGMPEHLKERLRRNQMSSIDGQLVAGYDPDFPSDDNALREVLRGYRRPDGSGPAKLGSDVLDILVRQGRV